MFSFVLGAWVVVTSVIMSPFGMEGVAAILMAIGLIPAFIVTRNMWGRQTMNNAAKAVEAEIQYRSALEDYDKRHAHWQTLFYCHRCDVTFVPGQDLISPLPLN